MFSMEKESEKRNTFRVKWRKKKLNFEGKRDKFRKWQKVSKYCLSCHICSFIFTPNPHWCSQKWGPHKGKYIFFYETVDFNLYPIFSTVTLLFIFLASKLWAHFFIVVPLIAHCQAKIIYYWFSPLRTWGSPSCFPSRKASVFSVRFCPQIILTLGLMLLFSLEVNLLVWLTNSKLLKIHCR